MSGEACNVGVASPLTVELLVIFYELQLARRMELNRVVVELDSKEAVDLMLGRSECKNEDLVIVQACKDLLAVNLLVDINPVFREVNRVAEWITRWPMKQTIRTFDLMKLPSFLKPILEDDKNGLKPPHDREEVMECILAWGPPN